MLSTIERNLYLVMSGIKFERLQISKSSPIMEKNYPLHKAIKYRNITKIKKLVHHIENINEKNALGYPPLVYACEQESNDEMLEVLFEQKKIDPEASEDFEKQNALHILALKGQLKWIKKFFDKFPKVKVDVVTSKGDTALIMAAKMDHVEIIEYLYNKGANINHANKKGFTALHYSANNGYKLSTKRLIELGSKINALDDRGNTPLVKASSWGFEEACKILLENKADANPALLSAARKGNFEIVKLLLNSGANVNYIIKGDYNSIYTPLGSASAAKNIEVMKLLIQNGADVNFPGSYSMVLFVCIKQEFLEGIKELIRAGVNLNGRHPQSGRTALETARNKPKILELLQNSKPTGRNSQSTVRRE